MKVLLVDDHLLFRKGLRLILSELNPQVMALEAGSLAEAVALSKSHDGIDLVLFDLGLPDVSGVTALDGFRRECEHLPVIVLSGSEDQQTVLDALAAGAMGFVPKTTSPDVLYAALNIVLHKGIYVPPAALGGMLPAVTPKRDETPRSFRFSDLNLTERQIEVFRLVVQGKSNKAIARDLDISESTIKQHIKPILRALGVTSRLGAILEVARLGWSLE